jgi:hypothetical protein
MATQTPAMKGWQHSWEDPPSFPRQEHLIRGIKGKRDFTNEKPGSYCDEDLSWQELSYLVGVAAGRTERLATRFGWESLRGRLLRSRSVSASTSPLLP